MLKHILKQIRTEHRQNSWIIVELIAVFFFLLIITDFLWSRVKTYYEPTGFDIENTFVLSLKQLEPIAPGYIHPEENTQTPLEELSRIISRVEVYPDIESLSLSFHSSPYSMGGVWNNLRVDSTYTQTLRQRIVTPSYFEVFRIRTVNGDPIQVESAGHKQVVLSKDVAEVLYGTAQQAIGKNVYSGGSDTDDNPLQVVSVNTLFKRQEFNPYEGCFFDIITMTELEEWLEKNSITYVDVCVRVRPGSAKHFEQSFITDMSDRLKENNLYISSATPSYKLRNNIVGKQIREAIMPMVYVMIFVLITVFLGVFGSFWLRTRQRRSEIGIRMAMGANKGTIWYAMVLESLCLMAISIPPALLVYINLLNAEVLDTWRLPFTYERVIIVFSIALLVMTAIIVGGTSLPANRAASIQPVDALKSE